MSLYIEGMEFPKPGQIVLVEIDENGDVFAAYDGGRTKLADYKAIPVQPHGRLKDADAIERNLLKMQQAQTGPCSHGVRKSRAVLRDAPTIISADPAEEDK